MLIGPLTQKCLAPKDNGEDPKPMIANFGISGEIAVLQSQHSTEIYLEKLFGY